MNKNVRSFDQTNIWLDWYAWHPVLTTDDGVYWLEPVYRRKTKSGGWEYRSLRTVAEKERDSTQRDI